MDNIVTFRKEEGSDNFPFICLLRNYKMQMYLFNEDLFDTLSNDGSDLPADPVRLTDYFVPEKAEMEYFCQLKDFEMPNGKHQFSLLPISNNELDPFCVGLISCAEMDASEIIRKLEYKLPYLNHYFNDDLWAYEAQYGESCDEVCDGFFSMEEAVDQFFQSENIQNFTIICNGQDYTQFFHRQARQAELKRSLSEYLPSRVVNEIFYSMSVDDFEKMTNARTENKEKNNETLRSMRR